MKKKIIVLAFLALPIFLLAQVPQSFNYQAVARNSGGQALAGQAIGVRFTLLDVNANLLYSETHTPTTNNLGLFTLNIGKGTPQNGNFENIDWSAGDISLRIEMDATGGQNYTLSNTQFLESVPFALYAENAQPSGAASGDLSGEFPAPTVAGIQNRNVSSAAPAAGDVLKWNGTHWAPGTDATSGGGSYSAGPGIMITGNIISNIGDLSNTNEFQTLNVSGNQLSISNGNSVALPTGTTYSAGSGITISGNTISAKDVSATNEIQTISLSGNNLSLSNNGGSVILPSAASNWDVSGENIINNNSGNVGIGTDSPAAPLHIYNSVTSTEAVRMDGNNVWFSLYDGTSFDGFLWNNYGNIGLGTSHLNYNGNLRFYTYGSERMVITPNGRIGMGISVPSFKLHVEDLNIAIHGKSSTSYGLYGYSLGQIGIYGYSNALGSAGIFGQSAFIGVEGITNAGSTDAARQAVRGDNHGSTSGWAGYFFGNVGVSGTLSKAAGSFKIDHPLDPENKYLYHSFVESPDMKNIYDGTVMTDEQGSAVVLLPEWFEALNKDFRYQLTVIGTFAQAIISQKVEHNRFQIQTDQPEVEVCWQITGIRKDPYAEQNRIPVEEYKTSDKVGKYLHPQVYGKTVEQAIDYLPGLDIQTNEN